MKYDPKDASRCLPKGEYPALIEKVKNTISNSSGNEMDVVTFRLFFPNGHEILLNDYIVNPATLFKLKQIAVALNKRQDFELGTFQVADHLQAGVTLVLDVEDDPKYGEQNKIKGYKPHTLGTAAPVASSSGAARTPSPIGGGAMKDEDIPFSHGAFDL